MTPTSVRSTRQRAAISTLLETLDEFRSAQELHDELRRRGENIGLTTVYRTLQSMATAGMVDTLRTDTGESVYRRCSEHHHHHLVCDRCGSVEDIEWFDLPKPARRSLGKRIVRECELIFRGLCAKCAPRHSSS